MMTSSQFLHELSAFEGTFSPKCVQLLLFCLLFLKSSTLMRGLSNPEDNLERTDGQLCDDIRSHPNKLLRSERSIEAMQTKIRNYIRQITN